MLRRRIQPIAALLAVALLIPISTTARPTHSTGSEPPTAVDFVSVAPQGFGDRQNSIAWSMAWWKGKLYVGTSRSAECVERTAFFLAFPNLADQVQMDPDVACPADYHDMQLQAEIWSWTPETKTWKRLYQSPNDVPIPDPNNPGQFVPGKFVARDIGFRGMLVFTEPDGSEALYVAGVSARDIYPEVPPPRILRSTDGETFSALPQDPGTFLSRTPAHGFRSLTAYKGRLYVGASIELLGQGPIYEAADPAGGNNNFRQITPPGTNYYEAVPYNGYLYLGAGDRLKPYSVRKTDATGWPYTFTDVVTNGAYFPANPSISIVSMHVFKGRLYVGTDKPAELFRINPDDSWELVIGRPRDTPVGRKEPIGGMEVGFDYWMNVHMWRMQSHGDTLYVGTMDHSTRLRTMKVAGPYLEPAMGFDLFTSSDGVNFSMVTRTGLGNKFNVGLRTLVSTPQGLFVGSNNYFYGLNIWQSTYSDARAHRMLLPIVTGGSGESPIQALTASPPTPQHVQADGKDGKILLSWAPQQEGTQYRVYRADFLLDGDFPALGFDPNLRLPYPFKLIATTDRPYYVDGDIFAGDVYQYYVRAVNTAGTSRPSTIARMPALVTATTFRGLESKLIEWSDQSAASAQAINTVVLPALKSAAALYSAGDLEGARRQLQNLHQTVRRTPGLLEPWRSEDLEIQLQKLTRRVDLVRLNLLADGDVSAGPSIAD